MWQQIIIESVGAVAIIAACITVISSITTGGKLDEVDTRGPRRRFPK